MTSHSAMNALSKIPPRGIGLKSQLNQIDSLSNDKDLKVLPAVKEKKFSLVPFAKEKS